MLQSPSFVRNQLFVDTEVQARLLWRISLYAVAAAVYFTVIVAIEQGLLYPDRRWVDVAVATIDDAIFWIPGLFLLGPIMLYDLLKITNRFAGPMYSLSREMRRLVNGEPTRELNFRDGDHWHEMADTFNDLRAEMHRLRNRNSTTQTATEAKPSAATGDDASRTDATSDEANPKEPSADADQTTADRTDTDPNDADQTGINPSGPDPSDADPSGDTTAGDDDGKSSPAQDEAAVVQLFG